MVGQSTGNKSSGTPLSKLKLGWYISPKIIKETFYLSQKFKNQAEMD